MREVIPTNATTREHNNKYNSGSGNYK